MGSELGPIAFSLGAAATWGAGDFLGGVTSKKTDALGVVIVALATGTAIPLVFGVVLRQPAPAGNHVWWAIAAGIFGGLALSAFYQSLAVGKIGINAPIAGVLTAAIPAAAGAFLIGTPDKIQLAGFALALVSIVLVSQGGSEQGGNRGLGLALVAGVGFGCFLLFLSFASESQLFWPLTISRAVSVTFVLLICLVLKRDWLPRPGTAFPIVSAGVLDTGGTLLFAYASQIGRMDVAAVLAALYPAVTVLLARIVLKERLSRVQSIGVITALVAITLIAA